MPHDEGQGASITFGTSGTTIQALTIQGAGVARADIPTFDLGTTSAKTYQPGDLYDPGTINVSFAYDPDTQPPFSSTNETITITYPVPSGKTNGATAASSGYVQSFDEPTGQTDQRMEANMVIRRSGEITFTDASS